MNKFDNFLKCYIIVVQQKFNFYLTACLDKDNAKEEEDDTVAGGGQGLDGVLDGGVALLAQVGEAVALHADAKGDHADDAGPVDQLGEEEGEVGRTEDDQWLHHTHLYIHTANTFTRPPVLRKR